MKTKSVGLFIAILAGVCLALFPGQTALAQTADSLMVSSSAQVAEVLINADIMKAFADKTGIKVELESTSSDAAVGRLASEVSDMALIAQRLEYRYKDQGLVEKPFLKDALVFITNAQTKTESLTEQQIRDMFAGTITEWKQVGEQDGPVVVVIPAKDTALYRNFTRMVMEGQDVRWDFMTARSTAVVDAARRIVGAISFVNQSATQGKPQAKVIKVDNLSYSDQSYPYIQVFSIVTKGEPSGSVKAFVDFLLDPGTMAKMTAHGVMVY